MATILALITLIGNPANSVRFDAFLRAVAATYAADVRSGAASVADYVLLSYYIGKYVCAAPYRAAGAAVGRRKGGVCLQDHPRLAPAHVGARVRWTIDVPARGQLPDPLQHRFRPTREAVSHLTTLAALVPPCGLPMLGSGDASRRRGAASPSLPPKRSMGSRHTSA